MKYSSRWLNPVIALELRQFGTLMPFDFSISLLFFSSMHVY